MSRSVVVYGALLVAALVGSYLSWTSEQQTETASGVEVASFETDDLAAITWETDQKRLHLDIREDDRGRWVWVEATQKATKTTPDEKSGGTGAATGAPDAGSTPDAGTEADTGTGATTGASDAGADAAPTDRRANRTDGADDSDAESQKERSDGESTTEYYRASGAVDQLFDKLQPLRAQRELDVDENRRDVFGFDDPRGTLTIATRDGTERRFTIGGYTYGRRNLYLRDDAQDRYFVVGAGLISTLRFADTRLRQGRAVTADQNKLERVTVQSDDGTVELVQHNRSDPGAAYWTKGKEGEKSRSADSWVGKLLRLQVDRYVADDRPDGLETTGVVQLHASGRPKTTLKLYEKETGDGPTQYFARSEVTRKLVELRPSAGATLVADIATLFGKEPPEPSTDEPKRRPRKGTPRMRRKMRRKMRQKGTKPRPRRRPSPRPGGRGTGGRPPGSR